MDENEVRKWKRYGVLLDNGFRPEGDGVRNGFVYATVRDDGTTLFTKRVPSGTDPQAAEKCAEALTTLSGHPFTFSGGKLQSTLPDLLAGPGPDIGTLIDTFGRVKNPDNSTSATSPPPLRTNRGRGIKYGQLYFALVFTRIPFKEGTDLDAIDGGAFLNFDRGDVLDHGNRYVLSPTKYELGQISLHDETENLRRWIWQPDDMERVGDSLASKRAEHILDTQIHLTTCDWEVDARGVSKEDPAVNRLSVLTGTFFEEDDDIFTPNFSVSGDSPIIQYGRTKGAQKALTTYIFTERDLGALNWLGERQPYADMHRHGIFFFREGSHTYEVKDAALQQRLTEGELHFFDPLSGLALYQDPIARAEIGQSEANDMVFRVRETRRAMGRFMVWRRDGQGYTTSTRNYTTVDEAIWAQTGNINMFEREQWEGRIDQEKWRRIVHPKVLDFFDSFGRDRRTRIIHYAHPVLNESGLIEECRDSGWSQWPGNYFLPPYAVRKNYEDCEICTAEIVPIKA